MEKIDVIIIGAGLSGLSLAYYLKDTGLSIKIIEARNRIGGRINTIYDENDAPLEMGATWLGAKHKSLIQLLEELGLKTFKQELGDTAVYEPISTSPHQIVTLPPNNDPSFRIVGGTSSLIKALANSTNNKQIILGQPVASIRLDEGSISVNTIDHQFVADKVVSTLPPKLLASTMNIVPPLPDQLCSIMHATHTWMGESIKVGLTYKSPFWRDNNLSGTLVSNVGPITEMYDHSNVGDSSFALKGFFNGNYYTLKREERLQMVLAQLSKYYGNQVNDYIRYEEVVWRDEKFTFSEYTSHVLPHQNNGHHLFHTPYMDDRFYVGGAETAQQFPGYMDGAVACAKRIATEIISTK